MKENWYIIDEEDHEYYTLVYLMYFCKSVYGFLKPIGAFLQINAEL